MLSCEELKNIIKKQNFLVKLNKEGKLELASSSEDICRSYLEKSENCLKSAQVLLQNNLWENSVSMSYYTMYNALQALLFRTGIKCENHTGSIMLLQDLFNQPELSKVIVFAKKERIDKQYYVGFELTQESAQDLLLKAEEFLLQLKTIILNLNNEQIALLREGFQNLV